MKYINRTQWFAGPLVCIFALTLTPAIGQEKQEEFVLEEVLVTATKREESLQDVAVSITAIGAKTIEKFSVNDFEDYIGLVPGLSSDYEGPVSNRGIRPIGLRGILTLSGTIVNSQNTVGFYIDNAAVPIGNPRLLDLERIEVLRGPQGHLYGSSSLAGTIKIVTKKPSFDEFEGLVSLSVSNTDMGGTNYEADAVLNIPLSDRAALRVSAYRETQGGHIDFIDIDLAGDPTGQNQSDVNQMDNVGGRVAFRFDATENFSLNASVMYSDRSMDHLDLYSIQDLSPDLAFVGHFPLPRFDEFTLISGGFEWDLDRVQIVSATSYFDSESDQTLDLTDNLGGFLFPPLPRVEVPYNPYSNFNEEWTHETRVISTHDGPFQYVAGVFYTDREEVSTTTIPAPPGKTSFLGVFPWLPGQPAFKNVSPRLREELAVFGEVSYDLNDQWRLVAGLRWFSFDFTTIDDFIGSTLLVPNNSQVIEGGAEADGTVPKLRVEYRPNEDHLIYASAAEGFRMGGANFPIPTNIPDCAAEVEAVFGVPSVPDGFESDGLWNYEVGIKSTLADGRVVVNAALFYIDWEDIQVPTGSLCNFSGSVLNAGSATSKGVEFELIAQPTDSLSLTISAAYIDAQINEDLLLPGATVTPFAVAGDPLPGIPELSGAIIGEYRFPVRDNWQGFVRADWRYTDERWANIALFSLQDSFSEANLRLGMRDEDWEFTVFVENVTDERPSFVGLPRPAGAFAAGFDNENSLVPRTYGVSVRRTF